MGHGYLRRPWPEAGDGGAPVCGRAKRPAERGEAAVGERR